MTELPCVTEMGLEVHIEQGRNGSEGGDSVLLESCLLQHE